MAVASEEAREAPRFRICWGMNGICGDGPRDLLLPGCECFLTVSKSGTLTGPFTVACVTLLLEGAVPNTLSESVFGGRAVLETGCAAM